MFRGYFYYLFVMPDVMENFRLVRRDKEDNTLIE